MHGLCITCKQSKRALACLADLCMLRTCAFCRMMFFCRVNLLTSAAFTRAPRRYVERNQCPAAPTCRERSCICKLLKRPLAACMHVELINYQLSESLHAYTRNVNLSSTSLTYLFGLMTWTWVWHSRTKLCREGWGGAGVWGCLTRARTVYNHIGDLSC
jgi:hypothetical protein